MDLRNTTRDKVEFNKFEIRTSSISGKGTFATQEIACGEYITTLSGMPVEVEDISEFCIQHGVSGDDPLQVGDALFLILNLDSKTINHSCQPNAGLRNKSDLFATRDIKINEEITYDYSTTSGVRDTWSMPCGCQSEICRKLIANVLSVPSATLNRYIKLNALPDYIKLQLQKLDQYIE